MRIHFPNAYRLWASLHRPDDGNMFIPTDLELEVGAKVPLELGLPQREDTLSLEVAVSGRRGARGRFPRGVFVNLDADQYRACREYLGIGKRDPSAPREHQRGHDDGPSVVVGDDDPDILTLLVRAFEPHGVRIFSVSDGESALKTIRDYRPRLVVLDVVMPGMDGTEVCRLMRQDPGLVDIPVVLISALFQDELERLADAAGASDFLAKPVELSELLNLVGEYLR